MLNADDKSCGLPPTCKPGEFTCTKGSPTCIPIQWRCDGQTECADFSDEMGCPDCGPNKFRCRNGQCIGGDLLCNDISDCDDNTDELSCCRKDQFRCVGSGECIPKGKFCDGVKDCSDNSDELDGQCNTVEGLSSPNFASNKTDTPVKRTVTIVVSVVVVIVFIVVLLFLLYRCRKQPRDDKPPTTAVRVNDHGTGAQIHNVPKMVPSHLASGAIQPTPGEEGLSHIGGSSNGMTYDRNHLTGASSSASPSPLPTATRPPMPSPSTTVARFGMRGPRSHISMASHSLHRPSRMGRLPPPTPCSTDFNEESDFPCADVGTVPHFTSRANSTYEDSDMAYEDPLPQSHTLSSMSRRRRRHHHNHHQPYRMGQARMDLHEESDYGVPCVPHFTSRANSTYEDSDVAYGEQLYTTRTAFINDVSAGKEPEPSPARPPTPN